MASWKPTFIQVYLVICMHVSGTYEWHNSPTEDVTITVVEDERVLTIFYSSWLLHRSLRI